MCILLFLCSKSHHVKMRLDHSGWFFHPKITFRLYYCYTVNAQNTLLDPFSLTRNQCHPPNRCLMASGGSEAVAGVYLWDGVGVVWCAASLVGVSWSGGAYMYMYTCLKKQYFFFEDNPPFTSSIVKGVLWAYRLSVDSWFWCIQQHCYDFVVFAENIFSF